MTISAGDASELAARAISASGAMTVSCSGRVPLATTAAGVSAGFPWRTRPSATAAKEASPMNSTSVPGTRASAARSSVRSSWPETTVTWDETPRCVTGMPADAGTADKAETPGTTRRDSDGGRERLLASTPEHERVAPLEREVLGTSLSKVK